MKVIMLDGYKTYAVAALSVLVTVAEGLSTGIWNKELLALGLLAAFLRDAINKKK